MLFLANARGATFTLYALEATTAGAPVRSERRFSDIHTFHTRWIEPLQSLDRVGCDPLAYVPDAKTEVVLLELVGSAAIATALISEEIEEEE